MNARLSVAPVLALSLSVVSCSAGGPCAAVPVAAPAPPKGTACAVWDREVDFARSVQAHDARAFAEHIHSGAEFVSDGALTRGPAAISEAWKGLLAGEKVRIDWHPTSVVLAGDGQLALSRGPFWIEVLKPGASPRFLTGSYQSVWLLGADGVWRVTIDGGTAEPVPATEEDVAKIKASLPATCAMGG